MGESAKIVILNKPHVTDESDDELIALTVGKTRKGIKGMWIIDSGATHHMTPFSDILENFDDSIKKDVVVADERKVVVVADERKVSVEGRGSVVLKLAEKYGNKNFKLTDVSFVPDLDCNLLSVKQLDKKGFKIVFQNNTVNVLKNNKVIFTACGFNSLYQIRSEKYIVDGKSLLCNVYDDDKLKCFAVTECTFKSEVLQHQRFGHLKD